MGQRGEEDALQIKGPWNKIILERVIYLTGGMGNECLRYHSRLAELIAIKKGEQYAKTGSEAGFHSHCKDLHSSVLEVLGHYEEFNETSRTRTLTLKLQKGPFERCVLLFIFFFFIKWN